MAHDIGPLTTAVVTIDGPAGALVGDAAVPGEPRAAAVLCHPHPRYGGDRRSVVVEALWRALPAIGVAALRFDFRGAGESAGSFDGGVGERDDVLAALGWLAAATPDVPLVLCGYSFGADVCTAVVDPRLAGWVLVAPPLAVVAPAERAVALDPRPKLVVVAEHDQFDPPERARAETAAWASTELAVVPSADHFLVGASARVAEVVTAWLRAMLGGR